MLTWLCKYFSEKNLYCDCISFSTVPMSFFLDHSKGDCPNGFCIFAFHQFIKIMSHLTLLLYLSNASLIPLNTSPAPGLKQKKWFQNSFRFIEQYICMLVAQSCPSLCDPTDCSPPGFSVHGILQARILECVAIPFSRGTSQPRDWTLVSCISGRFFTVWLQVKVIQESSDRPDTQFLLSSTVHVSVVHLSLLMSWHCYVITN